MKMWAYREDQRPTTHRIADRVPSTDETFLNFDGITYGKGAAVLKQLVAAIGPDAFRTGLQDLLPPPPLRQCLAGRLPGRPAGGQRRGPGALGGPLAAHRLAQHPGRRVGGRGGPPHPPRPGADGPGGVPGAAAPPRRGGSGRGRRQGQGAAGHHRRRAQPAERRRRPGRPVFRVPQLQRPRLRQGRPRPGVHGLGAGQSGAHRLTAAAPAGVGVAVGDGARRPARLARLPGTGAPLRRRREDAGQSWS